MAGKKKPKTGYVSSEAAPHPAAGEVSSVSALLGGLGAKASGASSLNDAFSALFAAGAAAAAARPVVVAQKPAPAATKMLAATAAPAAGATSQARGKKRRHVEPSAEQQQEGEEVGPAKGEAQGSRGNRQKQPEVKMTKAEEEERKARTLFVGNVPLDWDKKRLRVAIREAVGDKYEGSFSPIWFRDEPLKDKWTGKLRKAGSILKEYADDAGDAKIAFVVLDSEEALRPVRRAVHGHVADKRHTLRADGLGEASTLKTFDRKRSVFVGNLPASTGEADLRAVFEQAGEVHAVRIVRDKDTKRCKGIAFVLFKERDSVKTALQYWGTKIKDREIRVTRVQQREGDEEGTGQGKKGPHPGAMRVESKMRRRKKSAKPKHGDQPGPSRKGAAGKKPGGRDKRDKGKRKKTVGSQAPRSQRKKGKKGK